MAANKKEAKEKPLEKMTAIELRDVAKDIDGIVGVHGMNKQELISAIKESRGIVENKAKKASGQVREIKKQIRTLKAKRQEALAANDAKQATICRRKIARLKKKTRRAA